MNALAPTQELDCESFLGLPVDDQRLTLAALGYHIFPLQPGTKMPAVKDWENYATTDPERIRRFPSGTGTAVACGPSNIVVVDLDAHQAETPDEWAVRDCWDGASVFAWLWAQHDTSGKSWAETFTVATPSGGGHLYYRAPSGVEVRNSAGKLGWQVDTRAGGGYVVGPGTVLPTGTYEPLLWPRELPTLPGWVTSALTGAKQPTGRTRPTRRTRMFMMPEHAGSRLTALAEKVAHAPEGERNNVLNWAAHSLARDNLLTQEHAQILHEAATEAGLTDDEITKTIYSAAGGATRDAA